MLFSLSGCSTIVSTKTTVSGEKYSRDARRTIMASKGTLAPVYGPLAEQIVKDLDLDQKSGIGIDVGSGPGTLIIELCNRTRLHWINADINPHYFAYFYAEAERKGLSHRVSAVIADAQALPFRNNYADVIVSRGSFHPWEDKVKAFGEIYRVLKPGAAAYIGRGFSENLPFETAKKIRAKQGNSIKYDVEKTADELQEIMAELGIKKYQIHRPKAELAGEVNYGIWIEFQKKRITG
jgi:SAM-dependent methyltransferase